MHDIKIAFFVDLFSHQDHLTDVWKINDIINLYWLGYFREKISLCKAITRKRLWHGGWECDLCYFYNDSGFVQTCDYKDIGKENLHDNRPSASFLGSSKLPLLLLTAIYYYYYPFPQSSTCEDFQLAATIVHNAQNMFQNVTASSYHV